MRFYWLTLGILAVWRITHLLNAEDGPLDLVVRVRRLAGSSLWGAMLDCFYCLSVWIAAPLACWIGDTWKETVLLWPALSGGAILAERISASTCQDSPAAIHYEESEEHDELLRERKKPVSDVTRPR